MVDAPLFTFRNVIFGLIGVICCGLVLVYMLFQARYLINGPQITLDEPLPIATNKRTVTLTGTTANIARIWLNDRQIFTDPEGRFAELLVLENGPTIATLRAEDRYGRTVRVPRPFVYIPGSLLYTVE